MVDVVIIYAFYSRLAQLALIQIELRVLHLNTEIDTSAYINWALQRNTTAQAFWESLRGAEANSDALSEVAVLILVATERRE